MEKAVLKGIFEIRKVVVDTINTTSPAINKIRDNVKEL